MAFLIIYHDFFLQLISKTILRFGLIIDTTFDISYFMLLPNKHLITYNLFCHRLYQIALNRINNASSYSFRYID